MLGAPAGALISLIFLLIVLMSSSVHKLSFNYKKTFQQLTMPSVFLFIHSALSILATRFIVPVSDFLDALIIPHRLQVAGLSVSDATSVYGIITGMATTIVYMPSLVTSALAYTLSTKVTADWQSGLQDRFVGRTKSGLEIVWLWGGRFGFGFVLLCRGPFEFDVFQRFGGNRYSLLGLSSSPVRN
jgi:stage V sporulation protein B